ncbi:hypothetical protein DUNSADRAFT_17884 [Dunaliella salina]|uniref:Plastid lipid-associated protein/fibrillin conserved domain-containing protein n=1 Tax=Dunaliella salina TaxID=3046 RepID=A0ABQ7G0X3_DUNSA|nr:hypothetical protein DUNSADRAFT_17884 [Dunaliella salina]|eukprot:KAF5828254.1 hypothetical protein DUNSADRAFT_17884 [Dunaliella salina]
MLASNSKMVGVGPHRMQANVRVSRPARRTNVNRAVPRSRRTNVKVEAIGNLFNFLKPQPQQNPLKRKELVTELLGASAERKPDEERISNLVDELKPFGVKRPVRSTELFGEYQTVFSTSPIKAQLILNQPDQALEITETKSLGFLPATSVLSGVVTDLNDNTFEIVFSKQETKGGLGGTKSVNVQRFVTVVYLDSDVMVTQQEEQVRGSREMSRAARIHSPINTHCQ